MTLSIVSPVYNSSSIIYTLVNEIEKSVCSITTDFEIILVDDGSADNSWQTIENICAKNNAVKGIKLSRNFGQHNAIIAGLEAATGEWIIVMDCDLQDNPAEIPRLYEKAIEGFSIVTASRMNRKDSVIKKITSFLFWKTLSWLANLPINYKVANFGIYNKAVINSVLTLKDATIFFPTMILRTGFISTSIDIEHNERHSGESNYSYNKLLNLAINIILTNSEKPIKIIMKSGFIISVFSFLIGFYYFYLNLTNQIVILGYTAIIISIWFLGGFTIFFLGILGLYLGKIFERVKNRPNYIIEKKTKTIEC